MRVIQVVPQISEQASGPSYCVSSLSSELAEGRVDVQLHVLGAEQPDVEGAHVVGHPGWSMPKKLGVSPHMRRSLADQASEADIMHNHSLWMMPNVYSGQAVRGNKCRLVVSPHGTLAPWALRRSRWSKRLAWALGQGQVVRKAHCLHATSQMELKSIRDRGLKNPVAVIPNGIHLPPLQKHDDADGQKTLLFLGRIHPVKGVDNLLKAWRTIQDHHPSWRLRIAGPDNGGYMEAMATLANDLATQRVEFVGPVYGEAKWKAYQSADLYVLPTRTENFGVTIAEALASGVPAIVTKGAPWNGLEQKSCGWWIDHGVDALTDCLSDAMTLPKTRLLEMGQRGRHWMREDFSWQRVSSEMLSTYQWLLGGGAPPAFVDIA